MKRIVLLLLSAAWFFPLHAQDFFNLQVSNPQQWSSAQGAIDEAVLSIKPKGVYLEYGLYLTFSAKNTYLASYDDNLEVVLNFSLPQGSMVKDSWLWVGDSIVQAKIMDRGLANSVYEGFVNRRQDPSILFKNSPTQYELRVYPMKGSESRKVKITYLAPAKWNGNKISAELPMRILTSTQTFPENFKIIAYTDDQFKNPTISSLPQLKFVSADTSVSSIVASIPSSEYSKAINLDFSAPYEKGIFMKYYKENNEGYYQIALSPGKIAPMIHTKKIAFVFDYDASQPIINMADLLNRVKSNMHSTFNPKDSFNLIFSKLRTNKISQRWIPADSLSIEKTFSSLGANYISGYSNLTTVLSDGIDFVKSNNGGDIHLIANSNSITNAQSADIILKDIKTQLTPGLKIHTTNYDGNYNQNYYYVYPYNNGNDYFYTQLTSMTGGLGKKFLHMNTTVEEMLEANFSAFGGVISNFEVYPSVANGFCFDRNDNNSADAMVPLNGTYTQTGRFVGNAPFEIKVSGMQENVPFSKTFTIGGETLYQGDVNIKKAAIGNQIAKLESGNIDNSMISKIVDISMNNRILSRYTAFLALEPGADNHACKDCKDESFVTSTVDATMDTLQVSVFPNPIQTEASISIKFPRGKSSDGSTLVLTDVDGTIVKSFEGNALNSAMSNSLKWDGSDNAGARLSNGTYYLVLNTPGGKVTKKVTVMKQ